jgi:redox-regulated HSP33 family molecular chaperone
MQSVNWTTLAAFVVTVAAVTALTLTNHAVPAAISGALGSMVTALLPALMGKTNDTKEGDQ